MALRVISLFYKQNLDDGSESTHSLILSAPTPEKKAVFANHRYILNVCISHKSYPHFYTSCHIRFTLYGYELTFTSGGGEHASQQGDTAAKQRGRCSVGYNICNPETTWYFWQCVGIFLAMFVATKADIFGDTSGTFQVVFVVTKPYILTIHWGFFQPFLWPYSWIFLDGCQHIFSWDVMFSWPYPGGVCA